MWVAEIQRTGLYKRRGRHLPGICMKPIGHNTEFDMTRMEEHWESVDAITSRQWR